MNSEQSIFDLIEQYHLGLLSKEESQQVELRMKTDTAFSDYVKFNGFANEIVYTSGLDILRDQMSADLTKLEQKRTHRKWKIAGIIAALVGLSILFYFIKFNEKRKTFIPGNYQKNNLIQEQTSYNKINNSRNNSISTIEKIPSGISTSPITSENKVEVLVDKTSTSTQTQNSADPIHASDPIADPKEEITKEEKIGKDCAISFDAIVQLTCRGEQNGSIHVDQKLISGGTAPYTFHLSNKTPKSSTTGVFSDLAKGNYTVIITDSKACSASKEITVYEKSCTAKKTFSFNPDFGEKWEMQVDPGKSGSFTIYNRAGIMLRTNTFSQDSIIEWDGTNTHGALADMGVYMCTINYADGKVEIIELSIVR